MVLLKLELSNSRIENELLNSHFLASKKVRRKDGECPKLVQPRFSHCKSAKNQFFRILSMRNEDKNLESGVGGAKKE